MGWELVIGGLALGGISGLVATVLLVVHLLNGREQSDLRRLVDTPTAAIAAIGEGRPVEVVGVARKGQVAPVSSPVSGRTVLAYWIDVGVARRKEHGVHFPIAKKLRHKPGFWVEDASGRAWVELSQGQVILPETRHGGHDRMVVGGVPETRVEISPQLQAWAEANTGQQGRGHCVIESHIADGDSVCVLGWSARQNGQPVITNHAQAPLLVSTFSETQLRDLLGAKSGGVEGVYSSPPSSPYLGSRRRCWARFS